MIKDENLRNYLSKFGKRGEKTLSVLGKEIDFINAINSEVGYELLKDLTERHEALLTKIDTIQSTDEDKMEYKVTRTLLLNWSARINSYNKKIDEIRNTK